MSGVRFRTPLYLIYTNNFFDSNDDGIDGLPAVADRLEDVAFFDALCLRLFLVSPQSDFGYDIATHTLVDHICGTMDNLGGYQMTPRPGVKVPIDRV
jgi:glycosidase